MFVQWCMSATCCQQPGSFCFISEKVWKLIFPKNRNEVNDDVFCVLPLLPWSVSSSSRQTRISPSGLAQLLASWIASWVWVAPWDAPDDGAGPRGVGDVGGVAGGTSLGANEAGEVGEEVDEEAEVDLPPVSGATPPWTPGPRRSCLVHLPQLPQLGRQLRRWGPAWRPRDGTVTTFRVVGLGSGAFRLNQAMSSYISITGLFAWDFKAIKFHFLNLLSTVTQKTLAKCWENVAHFLSNQKMVIWNQDRFRCSFDWLGTFDLLRCVAFISNKQTSNIPNDCCHATRYMDGIYRNSSPSTSLKRIILANSITFTPLGM